ncbi:gonadotropin-releasing hormone receptor [Protopterus annectens]|uniref:gonadotropin-releasing hormone receptor n=1 Tax=Protopterus annectens TaxID=7888 RepID=UPI001CFBD786|nr:gonadotropin-releasing hormone receptor [Protopterus annectens]
MVGKSFHSFLLPATSSSMSHATNCCSTSNNSLQVLEDRFLLPTLTGSGRARVAITVFLLFVSTFLNMAFLLKLYRWQKKKNLSRMKQLLKHLMLANLVETVLVMPLDGAWNITVQWHAGEFLCKILNYLKLFSMYVPAFMVVVISLDRCLAITRPLLMKKNTKLAKYMLTLAWSLSLVLAVPQLFLFRMTYVTDGSGRMFSQCVTHGSFTKWWEQTFYNLFTFSCLFSIPLIIMLLCNIQLMICMSQALDEDTNRLDLNRSNNYIPQARLKTMKMTVAFATSFIVCWAPYYIMGIWYWFEPDMLNRLSDPVNHFIFLFGLLNPCLDPLIYGYFSL